ncbi:hypothetical protein GGS26DRAFT_601735 [Hypomontagnella submonticulosa]|nr:hypothetical protein GGS26DRAFT_601735 [Hypomontagnella submonticulosa]
MAPKRRATAASSSRATKKPKLAESPADKSYGRNDLDRSVPPVSNVDAAFKDMVSRSGGVLTKKGNKVHLRVATMCSGTEAPIFAMKMVQDILNRMMPGEGALQFSHEFACEIVKFKQGYILRNTEGATLFSDMRGFVQPVGGQALTAMGAMATIPGGIDLLVSGCSCVDFSTLNSSKKDDFFDIKKATENLYEALGWGQKKVDFRYRPVDHAGLIDEFLTQVGENMDQMGSSGQTFFSMLFYIMAEHPSIVILENVSGAPWALIEAVWFPHAGYTAKHVELDTKNYYVPQTRQRGYLIAFNNSLFGIDNVGKIIRLWVQKLKEHERRASAPVNSWLLPPADELTERARQDDSEKSLNNTTREVGWDRSGALHGRFRHATNIGLGKEMTQWDRKDPKVYDRMDRLIMLIQPKRVLDCIEINQLRALKGVDLEGNIVYVPYDAKFKNRVTDLSQNVDRGGRTQHGMAGCITPNGIVWLSDQNRMLSGYEALALQGLPVKRIRFATETQDQLRDLAGNAMTTTVFGAVFLSLLEALENTPGALRKFSSTAPRGPRLTLRRPVEARYLENDGELKSANTPPFQLASLVKTFLRCRRYCFCNGCAKYSTDDFVKCAVCGTIRCKWCAGNPPHEFEPFQRPAHYYLLGEVEQAVMAYFPGTIADLLDARLPPPVYSMTTKNTAAHYPELISQLVSTIFYYQETHVTEAITIIYSGQAGFELRAVISEKGLVWYLYLNAWSEGGIKLRADLGLTPLQLDRPIAKAIIAEDASSALPQTDSWQLWSFKPVPVDLMIVKSSNDLKITPIGIDQLDVSPQVYSDLNLISGTYNPKPHCDTPEDTLHVHGKGNLFLFKDATRAGLPEEDGFVISEECRLLETHEYREVILKFAPRIDPRKIKNGVVTANLDGLWVQPGPYEVDDHILFKNKEFFSARELVKVPDNLRYDVGPTDPPQQVLAEAWIVRDRECDVYDVIGKYRSLHNKRRHWSVVERSELHHVYSFLSHINVKLAAASSLEVYFFALGAITWMNALDQWRLNPDTQPVPLGRLPRLLWVRDGNTWVPTHLSGDMAQYESYMRQQTERLELRLRVPEDIPRMGRTMYVTGVQYVVNHKMLAYAATEYLPRTEDPNAKVNAFMRVYRNAVSSENMRVDSKGPDAHRFEPFRNALQSLNGRDIIQEIDTYIDPATMESFRTTLSGQQEKSLGWMLSRELGNPSFVEKEIEEELVTPLKLRLVGYAEREVCQRGGILADDVGYGKTVITLALIHHQRIFDQTESISQRSAKNMNCIHLKATLVVVPAHLVDQWVCQSEIFLPEASRDKIMAIKTMKDLVDNTATLRTLQKLQDSEIIVVSTALFAETNYHNNLAKFAGMLDPPFGKSSTRKGVLTAEGRAFEDWYRRAAREVRRNMYNLLSSGDGPFLDGDDYDSWRDNVEEQRSGHAKVYAKYAKDYKMVNSAARSSARVKNGKLAGDNEDFEGIQETAQVTQKLPKAITMFYHLLEAFSFARVVYDEFSYNNRPASLFVACAQSFSKWTLSATPPTRNLAAVCAIAELLNIHVAAPIATRMGLPSITQGPQLGEMTDAEDLRLRKFVSDNTIHERHQQGFKFLHAFASANPLDKSAIKVHERVIVSEMNSYEFIHYHDLEQDLRACSFDAHQLPTESRHLLEGLIGVQTWNEDGRTISTEALMARASWAAAFASKQSLQSLLQLRKELLQNAIHAFKMNAEKAIWLCRRVKEDQRESGYENAKNVVTDVYLLLRAIWSQDIATCGGIDSWTALSDAIVTHGRCTYEQKLMSVLKGTDPTHFFANEHKFMQAIYSERSSAWNDYYNFGSEDLKKLVKGEAQDLVRDFVRAHPSVMVAQGDSDLEILKALINGGHLVNNRSQCLSASGPRADHDFDIPARPTKAWYKGKLNSLGVAAKETEKAAVLKERLDAHMNGELPLSAYHGFGKCKTVSPQNYPFLGGKPKVVRGGTYTETRNDLSDTSIDLRKSFDQVIYAKKQATTIMNLLSPDEKLLCDGCGQLKSRAELHLVYECGHLMCAKHLGSGLCGDHGPHGPRYCKSDLENATLPLEKINTPQRNLPAPYPQTPFEYRGASEKTKMIINVIRGIPADEKILIFAQFTDQINEIRGALESAKIECTTSAEIEAVPARVRILRLNDETSAGSNFQYANHVLFASPLLATLQEEYDAFMRQSQGRCVRYGQDKEVHVYHFVTANTIEVDILELRRQSHILVDPGMAIGCLHPAPPKSKATDTTDDDDNENRVKSLLSQQEIWKAMNEQNWLTTVGIEY